jgi:adenylylsulfate kinase-like enzyme
MVIWLLGLSGSGKTTLGKKLADYYKTLSKNIYLIDGDEVRGVLNNDLGYSVDERKENIKRIILIAYFLEKNNIMPIVCNIAPFQSLRKIARDTFSDYCEIYLERSIDECIDNDVKGMYHANSEQNEIVGVDLSFDDPELCDLRINTATHTESESLEMIKTCMAQRN